MQISLDKNNYFTGNYATKGSIEGGIEKVELPPYEDIEKQISCKYENNKWIFDEEKYQEIQNQKKAEKIKQKIAELQSQLSNTDYKITKCQEYSLVGLELPYDIEELHKERQAIRDEINKLEE